MPLLVANGSPEAVRADHRQVVDADDGLATFHINATVEVGLVVGQHLLGKDRLGAVGRQAVVDRVTIGELVGAARRLVPVVLAIWKPPWKLVGPSATICGKDILMRLLAIRHAAVGRTLTDQRRAALPPPLRLSSLAVQTMLPPVDVTIALP